VRVCTGCLETLPVSMFHKQKSRLDGLRAKCKDCRNTEKESWRAANPDLVKAQNKVSNSNKTKTGYRIKHYKVNRDKIREQCRESYARSGLKAQRLWQEANRGKVREYCANRRVKLSKATAGWANREEMAYIHQLAFERGLVVDHIVPINSTLVCGLNVQDNLRCITNELNIRKSNKYWPDMPK